MEVYLQFLHLRHFIFKRIVIIAEEMDGYTRLNLLKIHCNVCRYREIELQTSGKPVKIELRTFVHPAGTWMVEDDLPRLSWQVGSQHTDHQQSTIISQVIE